MNGIARAFEEGLAWIRSQPAPEADLEALKIGCPHRLPETYFDFLRLSNSGEGELGAEPGWFRLWPAGEVLSLNSAYEIPSFLPGYLGFGSSAGGELLAFRLDRPELSVFMIPFIPMEPEEARLVAADFAEFASKIGVHLEDNT